MYNNNMYGGYGNMPMSRTDEYDPANPSYGAGFDGFGTLSYGRPPVQDNQWQSQGWMQQSQPLMNSQAFETPLRSSYFSNNTSNNYGFSNRSNNSGPRNNSYNNVKRFSAPAKTNSWSKTKSSPSKKASPPKKIRSPQKQVSIPHNQLNNRNSGNKTSGNGQSSSGRFNYSKKPSNKSTDITHASIPANSAKKTFRVASENLICFHGLNSVFVPQHRYPIVIDKMVFDSVDHYYQLEKVRQLVPGKKCEELEKTVTKEAEYKSNKEVAHDTTAYGKLARAFLRENKISRDVVEGWRRDGGVLATLAAMGAKAGQCTALREALISSADKILIHCYAGDAIFGSGTDVHYVHKWAENMSKNKSTITIPLEYPMKSSTIPQCPTVARGRNLLGVILMQVREQVVGGKIPYEITDASINHDNDKMETN